MREIRLNGAYFGTAVAGLVALFLVIRALSGSSATGPEPLPADIGFGPEIERLAADRRARAEQAEPRLTGRWGARRRSPVLPRRVVPPSARRSDSTPASDPPAPEPAVRAPRYKPVSGSPSPQPDRPESSSPDEPARLRAELRPVLPADGSEEFAPGS